MFIWQQQLEMRHLLVCFLDFIPYFLDPLNTLKTAITATVTTAAEARGASCLVGFLFYFTFFLKIDNGSNAEYG